jgi:hypothetical protein
VKLTKLDGASWQHPSHDRWTLHLDGAFVAYLDFTQELGWLYGFPGCGHAWPTSGWKIATLGQALRAVERHFLMRLACVERALGQ